jgi:hypothetical protein
METTPVLDHFSLLTRDVPGVFATLISTSTVLWTCMLGTCRVAWKTLGESTHRYDGSVLRRRDHILRVTKRSLPDLIGVDRRLARRTRRQA